MMIHQRILNYIPYFKTSKYTHIHTELKIFRCLWVQVWNVHIYSIPYNHVSNHQLWRLVAVDNLFLEKMMIINYHFPHIFPYIFIIYPLVN